MNRIIYSDNININTNIVTLSIDSNTGVLSTTYSGQMPSYIAQVGSFSSATTLPINTNYVLINISGVPGPGIAYTINFPTSVVNGTTITFRSTTTGNVALSGGTNSILNVGSFSATSSVQLSSNRSAMYSYFNGTWYGI